jgi:hypothetical protein
MRNDDTSLIDRRFTEPLPLFDGIDPIRMPGIALGSVPFIVATHIATETAEQHAIETRDNQKQDVLGHFIKLGEYGSTDYETSVALKILRTSAGKRRKKLCEQGLIVDSKQRRKTDTGSTAVVWRINKP